ncbi:MAG: hypothetical protein ABI718_08685 [Acidobacteriota bacterium]
MRPRSSTYLFSVLLLCGAVSGARAATSIAIGQPPLPIGPEMLDTSLFFRSVGSAQCGPRQITPAVASSGKQYLVAWSEADPSPKIYAERLDGDGRPLDGRGIPVVSTPGNLGVEPRLASNGTDYLILWREETPEIATKYLLKARVIRQDGTFGSQEILLDGNVESDSVPAVQWDTTSYLVTWPSNIGVAKSLIAVQLSADGQIVKGPFALSEIDTNASRPNIAWSGTNFMVVWEESRHAEVCDRLPCPFETRDIRAARVSASGQILDQLITVVHEENVPVADPDVAWNGSEFLVIYSRDEQNSSRRGIWGSRYSDNGVPMDTAFDPAGFQIVKQVGDSLLKGRLASDGVGFLVGWDALVTDLDVFASRVTSEGFLLDTVPAQGQIVAASSLAESSPDLDSRGERRIIVVYSRDTNFEGGCVTSRIFSRFIGENDPTPPPPPVRRRPVRL